MSKIKQKMIELFEVGNAAERIIIAKYLIECFHNDPEINLLLLERYITDRSSKVQEMINDYFIKVISGNKLNIDWSFIDKYIQKKNLKRHQNAVLILYTCYPNNPALVKQCRDYLLAELGKKQFYLFQLNELLLPVREIIQEDNDLQTAVMKFVKEDIHLKKMRFTKYVLDNLVKLGDQAIVDLINPLIRDNLESTTGYTEFHWDLINILGEYLELDNFKTLCNLIFTDFKNKPAPIDPNQKVDYQEYLNKNLKSLLKVNDKFDLPEIFEFMKFCWKEKTVFQKKNYSLVWQYFSKHHDQEILKFGADFVFTVKNDFECEYRKGDIQAIVNPFAEILYAEKGSDCIPTLIDLLKPEGKFVEIFPNLLEGPLEIIINDNSSKSTHYLETLMYTTTEKGALELIFSHFIHNYSEVAIKAAYAFTRLDKFDEPSTKSILLDVLTEHASKCLCIDNLNTLIFSNLCFLSDFNISKHIMDFCEREKEAFLKWIISYFSLHKNIASSYYKIILEKFQHELFEEIKDVLYQTNPDSIMLENCFESIVKMSANGYRPALELLSDWIKREHDDVGNYLLLKYHNSIPKDPLIMDAIIYKFNQRQENIPSCLYSTLGNYKSNEKAIRTMLSMAQKYPSESIDVLEGVQHPQLFNSLVVLYENDYNNLPRLNELFLLSGDSNAINYILLRKWNNLCRDFDHHVKFRDMELSDSVQKLINKE